MKKKKKSPKPRKPSVFDSPNWISESSVQGSDASAPTQAADGSGSGSVDPCDTCHIDFFEAEVTVDWVEGGIYPAASNLDPSGDGWEPDGWSLEVLDADNLGSASDTDSTIDPDTGEVTYGTIGQSLEITARVKRCVKCKAKTKLHVRQLSILRDGKDVTGKTISAFAGETVALSGRVLPKNFTGTDWQWTVPGDNVKEFRVSADRRKGERIAYEASDWQKKSCSVHWVDGNSNGLEKQVTLTATAN